MTYRVGNHHGVTIIDANPNSRCLDEHHDCARGHLVAVVVDGGQLFAEHICDRLNAVTPDVTHTNGAREALAHIAERIANAADDFDADALKTLRIILQATAAELGVDETAPPSPLSAPVSASKPPGVPEGTKDDPNDSQALCDCGHEGLDPMFHLRPCPIAERRDFTSDDVVERLDAVYCTDCDLRMLPGTRHPHPTTPVTVTVTRRTVEPERKADQA